MKDLWRFYDGQVSGVVIALTEEEAKERAATSPMLTWAES